MNGSRQPRRNRLALLLASALATAACGSTLQATGQSTAAGAGVPLPESASAVGGDGLGGARTVPDAGLGDTGIAPGPAGAPAASGGGTTLSGSSGGSGAPPAPGGPGTAPAPGGAPGPAAGTSAGSGPNGPGVTATTIALGIPYCNDCAAADGAIGGDGEDPGDTRDYYQAVLDEVNDRGGVLGRKLVPVFHEISASQSIDASAQRACEKFTKDTRVAVIFFRGEIVYECAKKAGIIAVGQGGSGPVFARYPNMFAPGSIRLERLGAVTVKGMVAAGWHKPHPTWPTGKIGLITWEDNEYQYAMEKGWLPALRESGLEESDVRYVAVPQSDKSLADSSAAISAAILSFRDQKIDHVFIADGPAGIFRGGGLTLQFLNGAKSQGYYPRYGFNSNNVPGDPNLPPDQQVGMIAVDSNDFERASDEGIALNPQRERCYALMKKNSLKATDGRATGVLAVSACNVVWFAEAVFKRSRGTTLPDVIAGAESLGTSYRAPFSYGTRLEPGRHDGVSFFRNASFDAGCSCMKYSSKPYEP